MAALGDWLVETHVTKVAVQAPKTHLQLCSVNIVLACFVVGFAVGLSRGKRDSGRLMRGRLNRHSDPDAIQASHLPTFD